MSVLSYHALISRVVNGAVMTGVATAAAVQGSSIDVTLGRILLVEEHDPDLKEDEFGVVELSAPSALTFTEVDISEEPFYMYPGQFVLACTAERFRLPLDLSAEFRLRSAAARMGLSHSVAVWAEAGWSGQLTLELKNNSSHSVILLRAGDRVGTMVFHEHAAVPLARSYIHRGSFNNEGGPEPAGVR